MDLIKKIFSKKPETEEARANKLRNEEIFTDLLFQSFKQLAWLGSAAIGSLVVMARMGMLEKSSDLVEVAIAFAATIVVSIFAQLELVTNLSKGKSIYDQFRKLKVFLAIAIATLGFGMGMVSADLFK